MKEIWKDIPKYEGYYQISNLGRVKSLKRRKKAEKNYYKVETNILNGDLSTGRYRVLLHKNGKRKWQQVSRLVAQAFIFNSENKPEVNHIDGNSLNNNIKNLEWCTRSENAKHAYRIGLQKAKKGEKCSWSKLTKENVLFIRKAIKQRKYTSKKLAELFNVSTSTISFIKNRINWRHI